MFFVTKIFHIIEPVSSIYNMCFLCYCTLVPRDSNDSQAHLKFCFAKGACEHLNHVLTHQNSKCFGAVCTVTLSSLLALIFDIRLQGFLTNITNRTDEVSIGEKGLFFPKAFTKVCRIFLPNMISNI